MRKNIYLTRHGQIFDNAFKELVFCKSYKNAFSKAQSISKVFDIFNSLGVSPEELRKTTGNLLNQNDTMFKIDELTAVGKKQGVILGTYFNLIGINEENTYFLTSSIKRTVQTANNIGKHGMSIKNMKVNSLKVKNFDEVQYVDYSKLNGVACDPKDTIMLTNSLIEYNGDIFTKGLESVLKYVAKENIIIVAHGNINNYFLKHRFPKLISTETVMGNCALHQLVYDDGKISFKGKTYEESIKAEKSENYLTIDKIFDML